MPDSTAGLLILGMSVEAKRRQDSYLFNHDISEARGWESTCLTCATPCIRFKHCKINNNNNNNEEEEEEHEQRKGGGRTKYIA